MDSADVAELEALLEAAEAALDTEHAIEAHCRAQLLLAKERIRELEAGLQFSCDVAAARAERITELESALVAADASGADCAAEVARLTAGIVELGDVVKEQVDGLLSPAPPGVPAHLIVTFDEPTQREGT